MGEGKDYGIKVYPLYLGDMESDSNYTVMGDTVATVANPHAPHRMLRCPSTCYLIDHPTAGYIMYDTGMPDDPFTAWPQNMLDAVIVSKPKGTKMVEQLAKVGVAPEDVKYVVSSHMHMDHIGNDCLFAKTADFIVSKPEAEHAYRTVMYTTSPRRRGYYIKEEVLQTRKSYRYLAEDTIDLFPGIDAYILSGHTPGTLILHIHLKERDLILTEDAIACQRNYDGEPSGGAYDSVGYTNGVKFVRHLQERTGALVLFGHDVEQFQKMKLAPEYYE